MKRLLFITIFTLISLSFADQTRAQAAVYEPLLLFTNGAGSITPLQGGQLLAVGQNYELTATPDPGFAFSSWQPVAVYALSTIIIDTLGGSPETNINVSMDDSPEPNFTYQSELQFTMAPVMVIYDSPGSSMLTETVGWQANFTPLPNWMQTTALVANWGPVASSADGTKLVVATYQPGPVCTSTNSGMTWMSNNVPYQDWMAVAASADGHEFLAANLDNNLLYISTNSGVSWFSNTVPGTGHSEGMACSSDGTKVAVAEIGLVCVSTNLGATWITNNPNTYGGLAFSADGTRLTSTGGSISVSTNNGLTWTNISEPNLNSWCVACSADGSTIAVANLNPANGFVSTNFGAAWNPVSELGGCYMAAVSADGSTMAAAYSDFDGGMIYTSIDFGATWTTNDIPSDRWFGVASSADGHKLVATAGAFDSYNTVGAIYTWYLPPSPHLNLAPANGSLGFSWLVPSTNLVLQQNLDLTTTNWVTLTNTPALDISNLQYQVILSPSISQGFYRLSTP